VFIVGFRSQAQWVVSFWGNFYISQGNFFICVTAVEEDWVSTIQPHPLYDIHLLNELMVQKREISKVGSCVLKSLWE
jgi:hypothetical protein